MALTQTPDLQIGTKAADFSLPGIDGQYHSLSECRGENGTLVMFICNHCPYVKAIIEDLVTDTRELLESGISSIAIMPNDSAAYPEDSLEKMKEFSAKFKFSFPYLVDESQDIARAYGAVCTPDFFGFNSNLELQYRGRLNATTPSRPTQNGDARELYEAMKLIAETGSGPDKQLPSMGCSIKWRGNN